MTPTDIDPYQTPTGKITPDQLTNQWEPADSGLRFLNHIIDTICYYALAFIFSMLVGMVAQLFADPVNGKTDKMIEAVIGVISLIMIPGYYIFFEGLWHRTPGKWMTQTIVISDDGGKPTFGQIVGRTFCRFIPFDALSFLGDWNWHDKIPKTQVVRVSRSTQEETEPEIL